MSIKSKVCAVKKDGRIGAGAAVMSIFSCWGLSCFSTAFFTTFAVVSSRGAIFWSINSISWLVKFGSSAKSSKNRSIHDWMTLVILRITGDIVLLLDSPFFLSLSSCVVSRSKLKGRKSLLDQKPHSKRTYTLINRVSSLSGDINVRYVRRKCVI